MLAWVEDSYSEEDLHSVVVLSRVDADGDVVTPATELRRAEQDIEEVEPSLVESGGALAVVWSRGAGSRTCGDLHALDVLQLVLLDAATWAPVSNVLEMPSTIVGERGQLGGVLSPSPVALGADILVGS